MSNESVVDTQTSESRKKWSRRDLLKMIAVAGAGGGVAILSACGGADAAPKIIMSAAMRFEPATLKIRKGESVTWRNESDMVHTATADASKTRNPGLVELPPGAEPWDSGNLSKGKSWSYKFDIPGQYRYFCVPHELAGMTGAIIVEA